MMSDRGQHIYQHTLQFKQPSGTSRGVLRTKDSWFVSEWQDDRLVGVGECSIIEGLNPETPEDMNEMVPSFCLEDEHQSQHIDTAQYPSISFGKEIFRKSLDASTPFQLIDNAFSRGEEGIPINGLIWMGTKAFMFDQIKAKLQEGFRCIKLKIGALDFEEELSLLKYIRSEFGVDDVELRVDANGAFDPADALEKLKRLAEFGLHSIEQPIRQGQWDEMAALCSSTPLDIALDEELIGISGGQKKIDLLDVIQPQFIILKPSLVGGYAASEEWISLANERGIGWWATSALESNIGLNAIAQWVGSLNTMMPQGLGTGGLYANNIPSPLVIKDAAIWMDPDLSWDVNMLRP